MTRTPRLTSDTAACCWIPLFALRSELARRPELVSLPGALLSPGGPPPALAGRAARPARGREAGHDRQPGNRALSLVEAVRARPGALRRAVRAARRGARHREPGGRAGGAGTGVRGDGWVGGVVRSARDDCRSD